MPKIDFEAIEQTTQTTYPPPFADNVAGRLVRRLWRTSDFMFAQIVLKPNAKSSERGWGEDDDEVVVMIDGEAILIEEAGETVLRPGDCVTFPKGVADGHFLVNRSDRDCTFVIVATIANGTRHYPDIDLVWDGPSQRYTHKDGTPY